MDRPAREYIEELIEAAQTHFSALRVVQRDERRTRSLIELEGRWGSYRIIISEIILAEDIRYAYYVLDAENRLVQGFDNTPDVQAVSCGMVGNIGPTWAKESRINIRPQAICPLLSR